MSEGEFMMERYSLDSFQLLPKRRVGSLPCFVMTVSLKICKVRIQAHVKVFKESGSLLHKVERRKGKDPQITEEGVSKHFIFQTCRLGLPHSYRVFREWENS